MAEMLSLSFDTEISSFFWGLLAKSKPGVELLPESPTSQFLPVLASSASPFLKLLVYPAKADRSIYSYIQYSATTAGVLAVAGGFSYCAYSALTKARGKLVEKGALKSAAENPEMQLIVRSESSCSHTSTSRSSRPDFLPLSSIPTENYLRTLAKKTFSINGGVVRRVLGDAEEDYEEGLQPEYFGPLVQESSEDENEGELDDDDHFMFPLEPPLSPTDSAYTSEYESTARPAYLRLPNDQVMQDHEV